MSLSVDVCVMELSTGREKWISLPNDNLRGTLEDFEEVDLMLVDSSQTSLNLGDDIFRVNSVLMDCASLGLDDEDKISALCMASGCDRVDDPVFSEILGKDFSIIKIDEKWEMTQCETAACWLATEEYVPFGELDMGDLVLVEDKLLDFIDWSAVWGEYESYGWELFEVNDVLYVVQLR